MHVDCAYVMVSVFLDLTAAVYGMTEHLISVPRRLTYWLMHLNERLEAWV